MHEPSRLRHVGRRSDVAVVEVAAEERHPVGSERLIYLMQVSEKLGLAEYHRTRAYKAKIPRPGVALEQLSMGMSGDFEAAIAEGATLIRVGTAIFGARG